MLGRVEFFEGATKVVEVAAEEGAFVAVANEYGGALSGRGGGGDVAGVEAAGDEPIPVEMVGGHPGIAASIEKTFVFCGNEFAEAAALGELCQVEVGVEALGFKGLDFGAIIEMGRGGIVLFRPVHDALGQVQPGGVLCGLLGGGAAFGVGLISGHF